MIEALDIHVKGIVQGVGFRPFVYRMARKYLINGWVLNAPDGVHIHAEGQSDLLDEFVLELSDNPPVAAHVEEIDLREVPLEDFSSFEIRYSDEGEVEETTLVSPDLAICPDCAHELFDPVDRRYRYPFINCTNCGPRFTIIEKLPYDRKSTSMKDFPMCPQCAREYDNPADRRFHAQPDACFECGPHLSFAWRDDAGASGGDADCGNADDRGDGNACCDNAACENASGGDVTGGPAEGVDVLVEKAGACDVERVGDRGASDMGAGCPSEMRVVWGPTRDASDAIFARAVNMLCAGKILAVKGLGGFHLVCDANNAQAVAKLRARKRREGKAFAVMMANIDDVRAVCEVSEAERALLEGSARPIVLLKKRADVRFAPKLADDLPELGVMLPYTPVQQLLLHDFAQVARGAGAQGTRNVLKTSLPPMLVMTSGNLHDEPIVTDDGEAYEKLACVADAFLGNNRAICARYDDSVVRVVRAGSAGDAVQFIRRARGFAPVPLAMPKATEAQGVRQVSAGAQQAQGTQSAACAISAQRTQEVQQAASVHASQSAAEGHRGQPVILAVGPEQKNTFTFVRGAEAFVSQHVGDLENAETYDAWLEAKRRYEILFELSATRIACDLHPEYLSTKWAHEQAENKGIPLERVQHHHAHIVSAMAESNVEGPACGIAFDGTGYGVDGTIWGGEVLLSNWETFERFANFSYVPMPGGAAAVKHPLRMAYGALWAFDLLDHPGAADVVSALGPQATICDQMIEQGINTPMTSSVGRLFDVASALLGICTEPTYEGEPAILLEAACGVGELTSGASMPEHADALADAHTGASGDDLAADCSAGFSADARADAPVGSYAIDIVKNTATAQSTAQDTSVVLFDAAGAFRALLDDKVAGVPTSLIARRFHNAFVQAIVDAAELVRGLYGITTVVLSGGVFMNRYLMEHALVSLEEAGFTAVVNRDLPPNDGCISFGQAVVAWARATK